MNDQPAQANASRGFLAGLTGLQKLTLALAAVITLAGAGLWGVAATTSPARDPAPPAASEPGEYPPGFTPDSFVDGRSSRPPPPAEGETEPTALELYSPTIFRLGFGFFVGFAIAYAIRAAVRVVLVVAGVALLLLVGLQMAGLITVNWGALEGVYGNAADWLAAQTESMTAFLRGYIPSGGAAVAGFGVGLTRKR